MPGPARHTGLSNEKASEKHPSQPTRADRVVMYARGAYGLSIVHPAEQLALGCKRVLLLLRNSRDQFHCFERELR